LRDGLNTEVIDISTVPSGLYLYQLMIDGQFETGGRISVMQ